MAGEKTVDEALENTINNFLAILDSDYPRELYPDGLSDEHIGIYGSFRFLME
ncbi:hypothetical protein OH690_05140 [Escherichia coli]|nr:hypothetical protein [Escherichia coli]